MKTRNYLKGTIDLPGDKSISHRAALFAAMAEGNSRIDNFASSADCASTLRCLEHLGVSIQRENSTVFIKGVGKKGFSKPENELDCGNSGTTVRLLAGILAGQSFESVLVGDDSLSMRPMKRIIEPLEQMNAEIESNENRLPLKIKGRNPLTAIEYDLPVASAQVKSCVLLGGLNATGKTIVRSPKSKVAEPSSRNHTELMLGYLGASIVENFLEFEDGFVHEVIIDGNSGLTAKNLIVPSDISSSAFFLVAAACLPGSDLLLRNVGLNPTRAAIIKVLRTFGAKIEILNPRESCGEAVSDLRVSGQADFAVSKESNIISGDIIANLIDEIPILAIFGTQFEGGLEFRNAEELRVKESDRISAVVENLKKMGADVEEFPDGLRVGKSDLKSAVVDSFGDHRIAMSFRIAALFADGEVEIQNSECAAVSFPEFFSTLESVVH